MPIVTTQEAWIYWGFYDHPRRDENITLPHCRFLVRVIN